MAGQSRTLKLSILGDIDQLKKSLNTGTKEVQTFGSKLSDFGKKAGLAFAAAGAAAAVYAGKLAVDGVRAAIADAAAQDRLALTLRNVTGATNAQIKSTEDYITKTSLAFGVTDDELRPSLERLARATGDVEKAQRLQGLAIDIATGSGKSLEAVSNALAKAQEGNTAALGKLGVGLSAATLKTLSMDEITKKLADTFENQASVKAETFQGKMDRLKIAFDEGKETVGSFILDAITPMVTTFVNTVIPALQNLSDSLGSKLKSPLNDIKNILTDFVIPAFTGPPAARPPPKMLSMILPRPETKGLFFTKLINCLILSITLSKKLISLETPVITPAIAVPTTSNATRKTVPIAGAMVSRTKPATDLNKLNNGCKSV